MHMIHGLIIIIHGLQQAKLPKSSVAQRSLLCRLALSCVAWWHGHAMCSFHVVPMCCSRHIAHCPHSLELMQKLPTNTTCWARATEHCIASAVP